MRRLEQIQEERNREERSRIENINKMAMDRYRYNGGPFYYPSTITGATDWQLTTTTIDHTSQVWPQTVNISCDIETPFGVYKG